MRLLIILGLAVFGLTGCNSGQPTNIDPNGPSVEISDFEVIEGNDWTGNLTYLDYSSEKYVTIPTQATVEIASPTTLKYTISYPEEPWEDSKAKLKISSSGRALDGQAVTYREVRPNGNLEIRTSHEGEDNNLPALIRMTYVLGSAEFSISKDVQLDGETEFINRNIYAFARP
ncbi:MAG: hypothetical protein HKN36_02985 [Hellea sp.]|nr:hypothetical protein [Hellea sp.]